MATSAARVIVSTCLPCSGYRAMPIEPSHCSASPPTTTGSSSVLISRLANSAQAGAEDRDRPPGVGADRLLDGGVVREDLGHSAGLGVTGGAQGRDRRDDLRAVGVALCAGVDLALERGLRLDGGGQRAADQP